MQVETFEVEEISQNKDDYQDIEGFIQTLNLEGQRSLMSDAGGKIFPYRKMTVEEEFIYRAWCPKEVSLEQYSDGPIPIRVLQVAALAKEVGLTDLKVWCPMQASKDDPILFGLKGRERFMLARWGEVLFSLEEMLGKALEIKRREWKAKLLSIRSDVEVRLAGLDTLAPEAFYGKNGPYYHGDY